MTGIPLTKRSSKMAIDPKFQSIYDRELAYLQEAIHESGYNPAEEKLRDATSEAQTEWHA